MYNVNEWKMSPRQDLNLWPANYWKGALSTELRRTHGEGGQLLGSYWHTCCILQASAMSMSYCVVEEWKMVNFKPGETNVKMN